MNITQMIDFLEHAQQHFQHKQFTYSTVAGDTTLMANTGMGREVVARFENQEEAIGTAIYLNQIPKIIKMLTHLVDGVEEIYEDYLTEYSVALDEEEGIFNIEKFDLQDYVKLLKLMVKTFYGEDEDETWVQLEMTKEAADKLYRIANETREDE
jgi:hypothetical protein